MLRRSLAALVFALVVAMAASATAARADAPLPTFAELEAAGATIGEIRVVARDVFDLSDPREDKLLYRWANALHIQTRPEVIERALLFKRGDRVSARVIEETERVLRTNRWLYDVQLRPVAWHDGVVDIEVSTRDTWSLDPGASFGQAGGSSTSSIGIKDYNVLGTGITLGVGRVRNPDRAGSEFNLAADRVFGTRTAVAYTHASNTDGKRDALSVARPFYALDARWAAGASATRDDRLDAIREGGIVASRFRHREETAEVFGGLSQGVVDGWVQRWSLGMSLRDDAYAIEPGEAAPPSLPEDQRLVAPFVRLELIEDRFERELNRNLIGRPEFFALGWHSTLQLGWAAEAMSSTRDTLLYSAAFGRGFEPVENHLLMASGTLAGQFADGSVRRQRMGGQLQYYLPQSPRWLFYASLAADRMTHPAIGDELLLGGDSGLRGYPSKYQSGSRRALLTLEERHYTDLYPWRLFRVGGAAYVDVGRAWGRPGANLHNDGWLVDAGVGLRFVNTRSAFSNVLHVDLAFPLDADTNVKKFQLLVRTKLSF